MVIWHVENQYRGEDCIRDQYIERDAHEKECELIPVTLSDIANAIC